jgi:hypothetical protein
VRKAAAMVFALLALLVSTMGTAQAESQEVRGDRPGDIKRIVANNAQTALTVKVFGIGKPCDVARDLEVYVTNKAGRIIYLAQGVCTAGVEWHTTLYAIAGGDLQNQERVRCPKFDFTYKALNTVFTVVMPRPCLDNAPDKVKVEAEGVNYGSATGGHAGPTKLLQRG